MLSSVVKQITDSSTFVINKKVMELRNKGVDVVNFGLGESNFGIPPSIVKNAEKAIDHNAGYYGPVKGIKKLRSSVARYLGKYGMDYSYKNIIIDSGSKHLIYCLMLVLANPGDEILLQAPYWVSYYDQAMLAGLKVKLLKTSEKNGFKVTPEQLREAITDKTRLFLINSPNNPAGIIYSREELEKLAEVIVEKEIFVISDEIYCEYSFGEEHASIASVSPEVKKRTIVTGGFSKSHSIGGWRVGFAAAEEYIIDALAKVVSNTTSCAPIICQKACVDTFEKDPEYVAKSVEKCRANAEHVYNFFRERQIECAKPEGAFYIFPNISRFFGKTINKKTINNSSDFSRILLEEAKVATLPGSDFGVEGNIRLALAIPFEEVKEGCRRMGEFLDKLG